MKRLGVFLTALLLCACSQAQVTQYKFKVVKDYPHDMAAYTQGLFFHNGTLYETTGQYGTSSIRTVNLQSGQPILNKKLNSKYFAEGSAILGNKLYILTWTNKVAFVYDPKTLEYIKTVGGRPLKNLNELEWVKGKIWANVYLTDMIAIIDPKTGKVEGTLDCTGLLPDELWTSATDVLNGIAVDAAGKMYVTGKNWPKLYQIELIK